MKSFIHYLMFMGIILISSCSNSKVIGTADGSEALFSYQWNLTELNGKAVTVSNVPNLVLTDGQLKKVAGSTGCNRITGTFESTKSNFIKFLPLAITKMACLGNNVETEFLDMLKSANNFSIAGNKLSLGNGQQIIAKFNGVANAGTTQQDAAAKLNGTWELNYITGPRIAFDGLYPDKKPQLIFSLPKMEVGGHTSCNGFSAKFTLAGDKISFGDPLSTMMACPGAGEPTFLRILKTVNKYAVENGNTLVLMAGDVPVMRFIKK